jgi:hypothetical protein
MCFDNCLPLHGVSRIPVLRGLEPGHYYLRFGPVALGSAKHWRTLADQFPGRWLLALGHWIMAVKIDTLETVPPHVAISESRVTKSSDAAGNERVNS